MFYMRPWTSQCWTGEVKIVEIYSTSPIRNSKPSTRTTNQLHLMPPKKYVKNLRFRLLYTLESRCHHFKNGGSLGMMTNLYLKNAKTRKPPMKDGGRLDFQDRYIYLDILTCWRLPATRQILPPNRTPPFNDMPCPWPMGRKCKWAPCASKSYSRIGLAEVSALHLCHGQGCRVFLGMGDLPPFNDGILISWGPINPYGLGLMSLSPIIWK